MAKINAKTTGGGGVETVGDASGVLELQSDGTTRQYIDANGNVGIGTSSPNSYGSTFKVLEVEGSSGGLIQASSGSVINEISGISTTSLGVVGTRSNHPVAFKTNDTERMRIDTSGNVAIGTNSSGEQLRVVSLVNTKSAGAFLSAASGDVSLRALLVSKMDNISTTSQVFVQFAINNNTVANGQINANGASQVAFGSWSDARLKENIKPLSPQLDNILALNPSEFDYIESEGGGHQIGFIAQEIQEVYPDVVGERADGMLSVTGWSKTEARLVKAIQEQQAIITDLKARIEVLENSNGID